MTLHQCAWCQLVIGGVGEQIYAKFAQENDVEDALIKSISKESVSSARLHLSD